MTSVLKLRLWITGLLLMNGCATDTTGPHRQAKAIKAEAKAAGRKSENHPADTTVPVSIPGNIRRTQDELLQPPADNTVQLDTDSAPPEVNSTLVFPVEQLVGRSLLIWISIALFSRADHLSLKWDSYRSYG